MQCASRFCIGSLLGPIVSHFTLEDLEEDLRTDPLFITSGVTNILLELCLHRISEKSGPREPQIKDIHVIMDETKRNQARRLFRTFYPSTPRVRGSYPLGIQYRFGDEIVSGNRIVSEVKRKAVINLRSKQKIFQ